MTTQSISKTRSLFEPSMVRQAVRDSFTKLGLRHQIKNPVMFVVFIGSVLTTLLFVQALIGQGEARPVSSSASQCGCGSPCCLPTLRRPWLKAAARLRRNRCARPARI